MKVLINQSVAGFAVVAASIVNRKSPPLHEFVEGRAREGRIKIFHYFIIWKIYPLNVSSPTLSSTKSVEERG